MLFHYACSDQYRRVGYTHFSQLIRKFIAGHGGSLPSMPLRHAIIALAASSLPPSRFGEEKNKHMSKAICALGSKSPETVEDTDLLTAYILWRTTPSKDQGLMHIKGMVAILNTLHEKAGNKNHVDDIFKSLRPLFVDYLLPEMEMSTTQIRAYADQVNACSFALPSWNERFQSFVAFEGSQVQERIPGTHFLIRASALFKIFRYDYFTMLCLLRLKQEREEKQIVAGDKYRDESILKWITEALESPESAELDRVAEVALNSRMEAPWGASDVGRASIANVATRLLLLFCGERSILQTLHSTECLMLATRLVSLVKISFQLRKTERRLVRSWLFLGGLPMSKSISNVSQVMG